MVDISYNESKTLPPKVSRRLPFLIDPTAVFDSTVLKGNEEWIEKLKKWLPSDQKGIMNLCYRKTRVGPYASKFHSLCDNKGPTVVLVKVGKNIFGGYASKSWGGI